MNLHHYLKHCRIYEWILLTGFLLFELSANVKVIQLDQERDGNAVELWHTVTTEATSILVLGLLIFAILAFDARFPIRYRTLKSSVMAHLLATIPFSLIHVFCMVGLRKMIFGWMGYQYNFGPWHRELVYEYLKDFRSYFLILAIIYLYRFVLRRLQGEAQFLERDDESNQPLVDRFLVKKLGREFLVKTRHIDWVEASGNYVNLHCGERLYPLRETMTSIDQRLKQSGFARVHRSAIVNLERVKEIVPLDSGDAQVRLSTGQPIPVSRRYRAAFRERLEGLSNP
jgi:hypothetical protein